MAGVAFYVEELRSALGRTLEERFPELPFQSGNDIPIETESLSPGAGSVYVDVMRGSGQAILRAPGSAEIPLVQIDMTRDEYPVCMAVAGYQVTFDQKRSYDFTGKSALITDRSVLYVRRVIAERLNLFAAFGDPNGIGVRGFLNNRNVSPVNSATVVTSLNYDQTIAFFLDVILRPSLESNGLVTVTDLRVPPLIMNHLMRVTSSTNPDLSALEALRRRLNDPDSNQRVRIMQRTELGGAYQALKGVGASNTDQIVVYNLNPNVISRQIEQSIAEPFPEEFVGVQNGIMTIPMFSVASATMVHEPGAIRVFNVPNA